jgi:hypothetical protein
MNERMASSTSSGPLLKPKSSFRLATILPPEPAPFSPVPKGSQKDQILVYGRHILGLGLQRYLIIFDPPTFVLDQREYYGSAAFALVQPTRVNGFHPSPCGLAVPYYP